MAVDHNVAGGGGVDGELEAGLGVLGVFGVATEGVDPVDWELGGLPVRAVGGCVGVSEVLRRDR